MNLKKAALVITSISGIILTEVLMKKGNSSNRVKVVQRVMPEPEICFKGVPLSKLSELAQQIHHGLYCSIDQYGFLIFHHKSNRGHQILHAQMTLDDTGKLINLEGHYPGQWLSAADKFANRANEKFRFER